MARELGVLEEYLDELGVDGYLVDADSDVAEQYYLSGFDAPDPYITLYDGDIHLLFARGMEYGRAVREASAETVSRGSDFGYEDKRETYGEHEGWYRTIAAFLADRDVDSVATPSRFPLHTADGLRSQGLTVDPDRDSVVTEIRARKTDTEIDNIRAAQRANEAAMVRAHQLLSETTIDNSGLLHYSGEPLTSEAVRREIEMELLRHGCALDETIVACGRDAADPHERGSGPLEANEPIIVDIFPRDKETGYHADMTRTFCRDTPSETVKEWYDLTAAAKAAALAEIAPGVTGEAVHDAACDVYEDAGVPTVREDPTVERGFLHSTGHGVGLEVHELPRVAPGGGELEPGHVITIEPGLYDPAVGGVRLEDLVVVTEDGYENLTEFEQSLVL